MLLVAALGVAGVMSAMTGDKAQVEKQMQTTQSISTEVKMIGGWCEISIYRNNVLVDYSFTYEASETACKAKALAMQFEAQIADLR
ncbi:hypothetical protein ACFFUE_04055 [Bergeyella porcorum]|uniref:hypothetical protein n=1 Tax=Bergeyella porcorum TaxID=1735111 RepID=UPI0035E9735D